MSIELARRLPAYTAKFPAAGYADIIVNSSYVGGQVRQFGNLSFSRIYDAGHTVPSYQPETAFTVFTRIINGADIGMGREADLAGFGTQGPADSNHRNAVPKQSEGTCWIRNIQDSCTEEEKARIRRGEGFVKNGIWYAQESDYKPVLRSVFAGKPGSVPSTPSKPTPAATSAAPLTGVYTASATPKVKSGASSLQVPFKFQRRQVVQPTAPVLGFPINRDDSDDKGHANSLRRALIIVASVLGSLLLL